MTSLLVPSKWRLIWWKVKWMWHYGYDGWRALEELEERYANTLTILAHGQGHQVTLFEKGEYPPAAFYEGAAKDFDAAVMRAMVNALLGKAASLPWASSLETINMREESREQDDRWVDYTKVSRSNAKTEDVWLASMPSYKVDGLWIKRVTKKRAGRLLDGVEWSQFPEAAYR